MRTSRYFLPSVLAGFLLAFVVYFGLIYWQLGAATPNTYWCFDMHRRKLATAESISGPKLLIVGGSGALFGIKARHIQEKTGIPTVNLGTHAALGSDYILRLAERVAKPRDTVLLVMEYEAYTQGYDNLSRWADSIYVEFLMSRDTDYFRSLPLKEQLQLSMILPLRGLGTRLSAKWVPLPNEGRQIFSRYSVYDAKNVDDLGDLCGHTVDKRPNGLRKLSTCNVLAHGISSDASGFKDIVRFCKWAKQHQVRVLATFPNVAHMPAYDRPKCAQVIQMLCEFYAEHDIPIVGTAQENMLPADDFFDTYYHLTEEAAVARTDRLIKRLTPFLSTNSMNLEMRSGLWNGGK